MAIKTTTSTTARATSHPQTPPSSPNPCQICHSLCQQRCQRCRITYYCSTDCQKKDWKKHRLVCKTESNKEQPTPLEAWKELYQIVSSSTVAEASQSFHQARDELTKLEIQEKEQKEKLHRKETNQSQQQQQSPSDPVHSKKTTDSDELKLLPLYQGSILYTIEKMPNLFMYQVIVHFPTTTAKFFHLKSCQTEILSGNILSVQLSPLEPVLQLHLPHRNMTIVGRPQLVDLVQDNHRALYLRLVDTDHTMDNMDATSDRLLLNAHDAGRLSCRSCRQALLQKDKIQNVRFLPSSRWEDMADYLTCLDPTNTAVESLSSPTMLVSNSPHTILQDTTTFVVPTDDMIDTSVCVLAIPGYGQNEEDSNTTGQTNQTWMQNSIGATLTCSRCADILGEASSVDHFRLFYHKLSLVDDSTTTSTDLSTLGHFIATELVRHAETHAVYSFQVIHQHPANRMLHIQLVSWESEMAYSHESCVDPQGTHQLQWRKVAKVLFYETMMSTEENESTSRSSPSLFWQSDWCCDPVTGVSSAAANTSSSNTIQLYLNASEWTSLKDELMELAKKQGREVADATILAKTGNAASNEMYLATLFRN